MCGDLKKLKNVHKVNNYNTFQFKLHTIMIVFRYWNNNTTYFHMVTNYAEVVAIASIYSCITCYSS